MFYVAFRVYLFFVKIPMMPKGVEHFVHRCSRLSMGKSVKIPMMPKGVEHIGEDGKPEQERVK